MGIKKQPIDYKTVSTRELELLALHALDALVRARADAELARREASECRSCQLGQQLGFACKHHRVSR